MKPKEECTFEKQNFNPNKFIYMETIFIQLHFIKKSLV